MPVSSMKELLEAGVHFGHHTRKWNPKMKAYIYGERNDIYIIDLHKTRKKLEEAYETVRQMAFNGKSFIFVGTKKQAQDAIKEAAIACEQYYVNHRWLGGMLTNWSTIQTRIDRLNQLDKMIEDGTMDKLPKKEQARLNEERDQAGQHLGRHPHPEWACRTPFSSSTARRSTSRFAKRTASRSPLWPSWIPTATPTKSTTSSPVTTMPFARCASWPCKWPKPSTKAALWRNR